MGELSKEQLKEKIKKMSLEQAKTELESYKKLVKVYKFGVDNKTNEMDKLKEDDNVKRYITLSSQIDYLKGDILNNQRMIDLLERKICTHTFLYLIYYNEEMTDKPSFRCLCCEKELKNIGEHQVCVNQDYLSKEDGTYYGDIKEYMLLKKKYNVIKDLDLEEEDVTNEMLEELNRIHNGKKNILSFKLSEEKRED